MAVLFVWAVMGCKEKLMLAAKALGLS